MNYIISDKESKLINLIKLISIILVLYIHSFSDIKYIFDDNLISNSIKIIEYVISQIIARAGVPMFFLISSLLLYRKDFLFKENLKKKIKRLLIPYLIVNTIWIVIFVIFQNIEYFEMFFRNEENNIKGWNLVNWIDAYIPIFFRKRPFVYPLWFLKDLFILNVLSVAIKKSIDKIPKLYLVITCMMWILNINLGIIESQSLFFFSLGYYIVKYNIKFYNTKNWNFTLISVSYFILATALAYIEIKNKEIFILHNLFIPISMLYIYIVADKFQDISRNRIIQILIKNSYFIYLFHEWNMLFVRKIMDKIIYNNYILEFIKYMILPFLIIIICLSISTLWERLNKKTYKIAIGE